MALLNDEFLKLFDKVDKINISEGVFYTLKKNDLTVYLSHFNKEDDMADMNNAKSVVAVYVDHEMILNIDGTFENVLDAVIKQLHEPKKII